MSAPNWPELRRTLEEAGPSAERRAAQRAKVLARTQARPLPVLRLAAAFALSAGFALAVGALVLRREAPLAVDPVGGAISAGVVAQAPTTWRFHEQSEATVGPRTTVRLSALDSKHVEFELAQGRLDLNVTHGTGRSWRVHAGQHEIRVVGTVLHVAFAQERVEVGVSQGVVEVVGPDAVVHRVVAGETWLSPSSLAAGDTAAAPRDGHAEADQAPAPEPDVVVVEPPAPVRPPPSPRVTKAPAAPAPAAVEPPSWRSAFDRGDYALAWATAKEQHVVSRVDALSASDLMALASSARLAQATDDAVPLLQRCIEREGPQRAEAAFLLGRIEAQKGHRALAARAFETSVHLAPAGALGEEAWSRLFEVLSEVNEPERTQRLAREYLEHFPLGASAARARAVLDP